MVVENLPKYEIDLERRPAYVFASVTGEPAPKGAAAYLAPIAEHCARCGCSSILIEKHTPEPFSVWDTFTIAPKLAKIGVPVVRIAFVEKGADPPVIKKLAVMVGRHTGVEVRVFTDTDEAKHWLSTGERPTPHR